ncbi:podoplanin [Candoia aspera]|uniref:podoplanin n=1 Tax=Candoia aspera TaxID=51853 RepID=UPI002FD815C5
MRQSPPSVTPIARSAKAGRETESGRCSLFAETVEPKETSARPGRLRRTGIIQGWSASFRSSLFGNGNGNPDMTVKMQLLVFLVAGATVCIFAKEATTPQAEGELATAPARASEASDYSEVPTLELITTDSILPSTDLGENTTDPELPETSNDSLETATLVGIIVGTIAAIAVATGIIIAVAKKMSGRYSP